MLTIDQLRTIMPQLPAARSLTLFPFLTEALTEFAIDTPARMSAFLAQLAHESAQFRFMEEIWGPTAAQRRYEPPGTLATTLGNTEAGDGKRFKGRGPIQLTGRANYRRFGDLLGVDLVADPARAAGPDVAFRVAGLFWSRKGLNELADDVSDVGFREITRRINGGFNGLAERQRFYESAKTVLEVTAPAVLSRAGVPLDQRSDNERSNMAKATAVKSAAKGRGKRETAARGLSLHIGLNAVNPKHYAGWSGDLMACEFDAKDMAALADAQHIKPTILLTKKATRANAFKHVRAAAKALKSGDLFFLSYSGHGGQIPDITGDEPDKKDETWCLYDGEVLDDEIFNELGGFAAGVRVLVLSDSCHSGTVVRARVPETIAGAGRSKMMPPSVAMRTYTQNKAFYDKLQVQLASDARSVRETNPDAALAQLHAGVTPRVTDLAGKVNAAVLLISGCQDNQTSLDGDHNGAFTEELLRVWADGQFRVDGTYINFHAAITAGLPATQTPNLFTLGAAADFARQRPFTVS